MTTTRFDMRLDQEIKAKAEKTSVEIRPAFLVISKITSSNPPFDDKHTPINNPFFRLSFFMKLTKNEENIFIVNAIRAK